MSEGSDHQSYAEFKPLANTCEHFIEWEVRSGVLLGRKPSVVTPKPKLASWLIR